MLGTAQVSALQATPPFGRLTDNDVSGLPFNNLSPALTPNFVRIISNCQALPNLQSCWTTLSNSSRTPLAGLVDTWTILSILGYASVSERPSIGQVLASFWTNKPSDHSQAISDHSRTILGSFSDCSRTILGLSLDLFGPSMPIFGPKPKKQGYLRHAASFCFV